MKHSASQSRARLGLGDAVACDTTELLENQDVVNLNVHA
jgi:hypothetical protein